MVSTGTCPFQHEVRCSFLTCVREALAWAASGVRAGGGCGLRFLLHVDVRSTLAKSCCDLSVNDGTGRYDPAKIQWNRSQWKSLKFEANEPRWFVYEVKASGARGDTTLEVSAYGDADCDGHISTFRYAHHGDPDAKLNKCVLLTPHDFVAIDPEE